MKKEDMFQALNDIDDEYIENANGKKKRGIAKWVSLAACFCIVVIGAVAIFAPNKDTAGGYDAGGANMDGEAGMYSIAVYPAFESEKNVADAQIITLSETEAYSFETLGAHLPKELPEGYSYQKGSLYDTTMKDGTKYYMLRITYANGEDPTVVTEDGAAMVPEGAEFPTEIIVMVTNFEPRTEKEIYSWEDLVAGAPDLGELVWGCDDENGEMIYRSIDPMDLSDEDIMIVVESMD